MSFLIYAMSLRHFMKIVRNFYHTLETIHTDLLLAPTLSLFCLSLDLDKNLSKNVYLIFEGNLSLEQILMYIIAY